MWLFNLHSLKFIKIKFSPLVSPARLQVLKSRMLRVATLLVSAGREHAYQAESSMDRAGLAGRGLQHLPEAWTPREGDGSAAHHSAADKDASVDSVMPAPSLRARTIAVVPSLVFILLPASQCSHCPETCMTSLRQTENAATPWPQGPPAPRGQNRNPNVAGEALHDQPLLSMTASCFLLPDPTPPFPFLVSQAHQARATPRPFHMSLPLHRLCLLPPPLPSLSSGPGYSRSLP